MTIMQNLQYTEHLAEPMADLVTILAKEFDYSQLGEEVLRYDIKPSASEHSLINFVAAPTERSRERSSTLKIRKDLDLFPNF